MLKNLGYACVTRTKPARNKSGKNFFSIELIPVTQLILIVVVNHLSQFTIEVAVGGVSKETD